MSTDQAVTRRKLLLDSGAGFGWLALSWLYSKTSRRCCRWQTAFRSQSERVVQVFCVGGMSHVDTFDYKPELSRRTGQPFNMPTFFGQAGNLLGSVSESNSAVKRAVDQRSAAESGSMLRQADCDSHDGLQERESHACGCADEHRFHS